MIRVRFVAAPGLQLGYSVERLRDGRHFDFADGARDFGPAPARAVEPIRDGAPPGLYRADLDVGGVPDGNYAIYVHDASGAVIGAAQVTLRGGDDEPPPASTRPPVRFPWGMGP